MITSILQFLQTSSNTVFWISAIIGTTLFVLRMLMAILGSAFDYDDTDIDFEGDIEHHHTVPSFKLFTLHSLSGFFMMFGWVGLACTQQLVMPYTHAIALAFMVGVITMIIVALIFKGASLLESPGTTFGIESTVALIGTVYQEIPAYGQGKINLTVHGVTREILAQSQYHIPIASFTLVKVIKVIDHEVVEVVVLT